MTRKSCLVLIVLALILSVAAVAQQEPIYQLGDKVEDFALTLSDGTEVTLSGLLAEKRAVVLNFRETFDESCKNEFSNMQEAYAEMSDDIALIALSCHVPDTDEIILKYQADNGFEGIPMGKDTGLYSRFTSAGSVPVTAIIDRNGVLCFSENKPIPDTSQLKRLLSAYTGDDYSEPRLLTDIPAAETLDYSEYSIMVTDANGHGVEGVLVQICDESTCRVETTDAQGFIKLEMTPNAYDVHVLMAPAGYQAPATVYTMPQEGGSLAMTVDKA